MKERGGVLELRLTHLDIDPAFSSPHPCLEAGAHIRLTVSDTGCGMDPATQARIFDPFFTTKSAGEGTGLGLAVVHGVVKKHGGGITVSSEPGVGTTFNVYLPVSACQAGPVVHNSVSVPRGHSDRILL